MKKINLLFIFIFCFQWIFAQSNCVNNYKNQKLQRTELIKKRANDNPCNRFGYFSESGKLNKAGKQILIEQTDQVWDSASQKIIKFQKIEFVYDANELKITETYFDWNALNEMWEKTEKNDYTRDIKGNLTSVLNSRWNELSGNWENNFRDDYYYNINNEMITDLYSEWDFSKSIWLKVSKIENTYDANQRVLTDIYSEWDEIKSTYIFYDKLEYTYDANGNKLTDSYLKWNASTSKWLAIDQYINTFDAGNNLIESVYSDWDNTARKWNNKSKDAFTYDANNNMLTDIYTIWNSTTSLWVNSQKTANFYDLKNNRIQSNDSIWNIRRWVNNYKSESSFDIAITTAQLVLPFDPDVIKLYFKTKLTETNQFDWNKVLGVWNKTGITTYTYKIDNSSINSISDHVFISYYPNPCSELVNINVANYPGAIEVKIYNTAGQKIKSESAGGNGFINVSDLSAGIYIMQISSGQTVFGCRKLVIE